MATDGKKKSNEREPGAKKRKVRSSKAASKKASASRQVEAGEPEVRRTKDDVDERDAGLLVPGQNLIGPGAEPISRVDTPSGEIQDDADGTPADLGATKYVHAAFFAAGILTAYLSGKLLALIWGQLAEWPDAVAAVPALLSVGESRRGTYTMLVGVVVGVIAVVQTYRKAKIRKWADEVALELSKVTWPDKETVTNGTIVVIVGSTVATVYVALLDRVWMFVTALIYGS
jgi:preprotein translocase subunit SecE